MEISGIKTVMITVPLCEFTKKHWILYFFNGECYGVWITSQLKRRDLGIGFA